MNARHPLLIVFLLASSLSAAACIGVLGPGDENSSGCEPVNSQPAERPFTIVLLTDSADVTGERRWNADSVDLLVEFDGYHPYTSVIFSFEPMADGTELRDQGASWKDSSLVRIWLNSTAPAGTWTVDAVGLEFVSEYCWSYGGDYEEYDAVWMEPEEVDAIADGGLAFEVVNGN